MYSVCIIYVLDNMSHNTCICITCYTLKATPRTNSSTRCKIFLLCMSDSSHRPGSCTPCCSANCSARSPLPVCFTACTAVCHVRGRSPVPLSWSSHLSSSRKIQVFTSELSLLIPSMTEGFTHRYVPNDLHWASN